MNIPDDVLDQIREHVNATAERECCGLIVATKKKLRYVPVKNIATTNEHFVMDPQEQAAAEDSGEVMAIVHSHPKEKPTPSEPDLAQIERTQLPWLIMNWPLNTYTITEPSGYQAPLIGRQFQHGVLDCYTLIQDAFKREKNITLMDFHSEDQWWLKGLNHYREQLPIAGFVEMNRETYTLQPWDLITMKVASPVENHAAIYLGDNVILHHVMGRLSGRDVYGGWWREITRGIWRHKDLA